jgi:hypothetical protein
MSAATSASEVILVTDLRQDADDLRVRHRPVGLVGSQRALRCRRDSA